MSKEQRRVESPDGATLFVEQNLYDAGDPDYALAVSAHKVKGGSACNLWINQSGAWRPILPERFIEGRGPTPYMLMGEVTRLLQDPEKASVFEEDIRLNLGIKGLILIIEAMFEK